MKKMHVVITAKVEAVITVPDHITEEDVRQGTADIYFYPNSTPHIEKQDLGADRYIINVTDYKEHVVSKLKSHEDKLTELLSSGIDTEHIAGAVDFHQKLIKSYKEQLAEL